MIGYIPAEDSPPLGYEDVTPFVYPDGSTDWMPVIIIAAMCLTALAGSALVYFGTI